MLSITPSSATTVGLQVFATANVQGVSGGTVTFRLFSPDDAVTPVFTSVKAVNGVSINSDRFSTSRSGKFKWTGEYRDAANGGAQLAGPVEVIVDPARTVLTVKALPFTGGTLQGRAKLAGGFNPTGTITFFCHRAQNDVNPCDSPPVFTFDAPVHGPAEYDSGPFTPTLPGTYRWRASYSGDHDSRAVTVTACITPESSVEVVLPGPPSGRFNPLTPARVLDTRAGGNAGAVGPGATIDIPFAGVGGVPASGAVAVAMNVTVTQPTASGFVTMFPTGASRPLAANLNFTPGKTVPNLVVAKLGAGGRVSLFSSAGSTHVVIDVAGWFSGLPAGNDGRFQPVVPTRILDTRNGGTALGTGASVDVAVAGQGGVPAAGAEAAVVNVAATNTTDAGFLTLHPAGEPRPTAANLNFGPSETVSNRAIVKLGQGGRLTIFNGRGSADVVVDVCGWFTDRSQAGSSGVFTALPPARLLDTAHSGAPPLVGGGTADVQVAGQAGVPTVGIGAVVLNVCVHSSAAAGFLTVFRAGAAQPTVSDLNFGAGEVRPNLVVAPVSAAGKVSLFASTGCHVVIDVAGWFS
jgi:hypothetical protein